MDEIYLNHAATSYPKPPAVIAAVNGWLSRPPADPGRGASLAPDLRRTCREALARLFDVAAAEQIVLPPSATHGANLVLLGRLTARSHVVCTRLEHNSVLRPIAHRSRDAGVQVSWIGLDRAGQVSPDAVRDALCPGTRLVVVSHASNVSGGLQPVEAICDVAARAGVPVLVDACQSSGAIPISHRSLPGKVYLLASGHKGLLGPPGIGVLVVPDDSLPQTVVGGTGSHSEARLHPGQLPLRHEAGTPPWPAIAGLTAAVEVVAAGGIDAAGRHRHELASQLADELAAIDGVAVVPVARGDRRSGIVSFTLRGWSPESVADALERAFGIHARAGLHCAPLIHADLGTAPLGTVRASVGWGSERSHVRALASAVAEMARG